MAADPKLSTGEILRYCATADRRVFDVPLDRLAGPYVEHLTAGEMPTDDELDAVARDRCVTAGMLARAYEIPRVRDEGGRAMNAPCWQLRMEVDPRYDYTADTFDETAPLWAPNCGHAACIKDQELCPNWHDWDCPVAVCHYSTAHAMCDLDAGHDGEHVFISADEIVLEFMDPAPATVAPGGRLP